MLIFFIIYFELIILICFKLATYEKNIYLHAYGFTLTKVFASRLVFYITLLQGFVLAQKTH